ncbi:pilin [Cocleimonas sp. KMM 6892]|nr:pilin [Cocleimonas sp. KMM 6892]MEC4716950.1 pilin [Cocleimonas sp. KMM 6895]MEC4743962.1 pilin [Cocleimonas sp. KMM 6896]
MTEAVTLMSAQKATIAEIAADEGIFDNADNGSLGLPAAADIAGKYTASVAIADGVMTATMGAAGTVSAGIAAGTLTMTPTLNASGIISWDCGAAGNVADKYRPKACR